MQRALAQEGVAFPDIDAACTSRLEAQHRHSCRLAFLGLRAAPGLHVRRSALLVSDTSSEYSHCSTLGMCHADSAAELAQKANTLPGGNETGSARVGERCRVFWPQDKEWHEAIVAGFEPVTARHSLKYTSDANVSALAFSVRTMCR